MSRILRDRLEAGLGRGLRHPVYPRGVSTSLSLNGATAVIAPAIHDARVLRKMNWRTPAAFGGSREMQRTLDIDASIKFDRTLLVLMMDARR